MDDNIALMGFRCPIIHNDPTGLVCGWSIVCAVAAAIRVAKDDAQVECWISMQALGASSKQADKRVHIVKHGLQTLGDLAIKLRRKLKAIGKLILSIVNI